METSDLIHPTKDESTYANIDDIITTHFHLDLTVDFNVKKLYGIITLNMKTLKDTENIILDCQGVDVSGILDGNGNTLNFKVTTPNEELGSALNIIPASTIPAGT